MAASRESTQKWMFTREQLESSPSRRSGVEPDRELSYRQQAANLIQDMGQRLNVSQLTINTAIVYMHRFYMVHSFTKFHRNVIAPATLFLAAKVEEQPRKLDSVLKVAHTCLNPQEPPLDTKSNAYIQQAQELVMLESVVLQTLGFEITIDHPHTDVVKCTQLVRASKDLAQTSYFMATNSLHLTTFCLQYRPTVVACVCIHLACKWSNWEIPVSTDCKHWWEYVDSSVTLELLDELTHEFLQILEKTPSKLKRIRNWRATQAAKKPRADGQFSSCSASAGPSSSQDQLLLDAVPSASSVSTAFPKPSASFPGPLTVDLDGSLSMDPLPGTQGASYAFQAPTDWPEKLVSDTYTLKAMPSHIARQIHPTKHEHKANSGAAPSCPPQKLSLEKYKEKHAAELAAQRHRLEQQRPEQHRKPSQQAPKARPPPPGTDKRDKVSEKAKEELKMKIQVSTERHSSSDEGGGRSKQSKSKHQHHHHHQHKHAHPYPPNGRGLPPDGPGAHKSPAGFGSGSDGSGSGSGSGSSRKRSHPDAGHNHQLKKSKSSKSGAGHSSSLQQGVSSPPPPPPPPSHNPHPSLPSGHQVKADRRPTEGATNGLHADYTDSFDILDSLLSAQGMNL